MNLKETQKSIEVLVKYEKKIGHKGPASADLQAAVGDGGRDGVWRRYLLNGSHLADVAGWVVLRSEDGVATPSLALTEIRRLVESAHKSPPRSADGFLGKYLNERSSLPASFRERLDRLAKKGEREIPLCAAGFARELARLGRIGAEGAEAEVHAHWYAEILEGRVRLPEARRVPAKITKAAKRLTDHLRSVERDKRIGERTAYERYAGVLKSHEMTDVTDILIRMHGSRPVLGVVQIEPFLKHYSKAETLNRLRRLIEWFSGINTWNNEGVSLTPRLMGYLSQKNDFESLLKRMDFLRAARDSGKFHIDDPLARELEFLRFSVYNRFTRHPKTDEELYEMFQDLKPLPPQKEVPIRLDMVEMRQVKRTAYEAFLFLEFLKAFKARTERHVVVIGNDRYGRQWVVEPIAEQLKDGFSLRYDRVESGHAYRLKTPPVFPETFVRELSDGMPHVVIVDGAKPFRKLERKMRFSRSMRAYANWFSVFNDLRSEGDVSSFEAESGLPPYHVRELKRWHEFTRLRRQMRDWVTPGETYSVRVWAPEWYRQVQLGDVEIEYQPIDTKEDRPMVVMANSNVSGEDWKGFPAELRGTRTYYFDGPEDLVKEELVFGFGDYGVETRTVGPTTVAFIAEVRKQIAAEVGRLVASGCAPKVRI